MTGRSLQQSVANVAGLPMKRILLGQLGSRYLVSLPVSNELGALLPERFATLRG
jgi:hypothetical protein